MVETLGFSKGVQAGWSVTRSAQQDPTTWRIQLRTAHNCMRRAHLSSVAGVGGPTVANWGHSSAMAMKEAAQVSVRP